MSENFPLYYFSSCGLKETLNALYFHMGGKKKLFLQLCLFFLFFPYFIRILQTLCRKLKLPESFEFRHLARLTPGYVGADLMALCREAAMGTVNRILIAPEQHARNPAEGNPGTGADIRLEEGTKQPELPPKVCVA